MINLTDFQSFFKDKSDKNQVLEDERIKAFSSKYYNFIFDKKNGTFYRWGETLQQDPKFSPFGPEILDIEISSGKCLGNCPFCYKNNRSHLEVINMDFETFKKIFDKIPKTLTQIAFGITDIDTNPDFWKILNYSKERGIIPNYTCNGFNITKEIARKTAKVCGAVAVSIYDKEKTYNAVKLFSEERVPQVNLHFMLANETYNEALNILKDINNDDRLINMHAIVFLQYKPMGRGIGRFSPIGIEKIKNLVKITKHLKIKIGFDSCSAPLYFQAISKDKHSKIQSMFVEPCESSLFSGYINAKGNFFPCSFSETKNEWIEGINIISTDNFVEDIWFSEKLVKWREKLMLSSSKCNCKFNTQCRNCPIYSEITPCSKFYLPVIS